MRTNFDIDVLRTFIESVRHRSLAKAAERGGKSPSTVTLQIQRLEQQIGVKLFQRAGRGVLPTEDALRLLPYAERIVLANDEGVRALAPAPTVETIRIAVPADIAETWLPLQLSEFLALHPNVSVEAQVLRNSEIIELVDKGAADLVLHWSRSDRRSAVRPVATFPIEWMASASFAADPDRALPLVILQSPCLFRDLGVKVLESGNIPVRTAMATTGVTGLWSAVAAGLGVTCRVPFGAPEGVVRYGDERLPALGEIDLVLRASRSTDRIVHDLETHLQKAIWKLGSGSQ